jgi:hypothetical protein
MDDMQTGRQAAKQKKSKLHEKKTKRKQKKEKKEKHENKIDPKISITPVCLPGRHVVTVSTPPPSPKIYEAQV